MRINGQLVELQPEDMSLGGFSQAMALTDNYLVAGSVSTEPNEILLDTLEDCNDEETRGDFPVEVCYNNAVRGLESNYNRALNRFFRPVPMSGNWTLRAI